MKRRTLLKALLGVPFLGVAAAKAVEQEPLTFELPGPFVAPDPDDHARHIREHAQLREDLLAASRVPKCCNIPMNHATAHAGYECVTCGCRVGYAEFHRDTHLMKQIGSTDWHYGPGLKPTEFSVPSHWHPDAKRCAMCGGTGVHECPGGSIRALPGTDLALRRLGSVTRMFPGRVDADAYSLAEWERV